jgi:hypothetical protein
MLPALLTPEPSVAGWQQGAQIETGAVRHGAWRVLARPHPTWRARWQAGRRRGRGSSRSPPVWLFCIRGAFEFETARVAGLPPAAAGSRCGYERSGRHIPVMRARDGNRIGEPVSRHQGALLRDTTGQVIKR